MRITTKFTSGETDADCLVPKVQWARRQLATILDGLMTAPATGKRKLISVQVKWVWEIEDTEEASDLTPEILRLIEFTRGGDIDAMLDLFFVNPADALTAFLDEYAAHSDGQEPPCWADALKAITYLADERTANS